MKSSHPLFRSRTIAVTDFLLLLLLAVVAIFAPSVSATATATAADRSLESPPIIPPPVIDICLDDPSFVFGRNGEKDCAHVASQNERKKERLCRKGKVETNCKNTCDNCDPRLKDTCPGRQSKLNYPGPCDEYETDLRCDYGYVYAGCDETGGDEDDMVCIPTQIYHCEDDGGGEKNWQLMIADPFRCDDTSVRPYGAKCDPTECPPVEPLEGGSCSWYESRDSCGYDPLWFGCTYEELECRPSVGYSCDPISDTWSKSIEPQPRCAALPGIPHLEACDVGDPKPEPPPPPCGVGDEPTPGDLCDPGADEPCLGGYSVRGCAPGSLVCSPGVEYTCTDQFEGEVGTGPRWNADFIPQSECIADDPLWGRECDPLGCPPSKPVPGGSCSEVDLRRSDRCPYDYKVLGCFPETLQCTATTSFACGRDDLWKEKTVSLPECSADDPLWDTDCSPLECPPSPPTDGEDCSLEGETCSYDYKVRGCASDSLECLALTVFKCNQKGTWRDKSPQLPLCVAEDPLWDADCTAACPIERPAIGRACSSSDNDETCYYDYEARGCESDGLSCVPTVALECGPDERWADTGLQLIQCATDDDDISGTPCTPGDDLPVGPR